MIVELPPAKKTEEDKRSKPEAQATFHWHKQISQSVEKYWCSLGATGKQNLTPSACHANTGFLLHMQHGGS